MLLVQDGSTTRLCEAIAGGPIQVLTHLQHSTQEVPEIVRHALPGERYLERLISLVAHGQVMMDNLSYVSLRDIDDTLRADLEAGDIPIGHLLDRMWVRREPGPSDAAATLQQRLWEQVGEPDAGASRVYRIIEPQGPRMLIAETFRRGMLMD